MVRYSIIEDFLTSEECAQLIEAARPRLEKSGSWDLKTASTQYTDYRTSEQMYFQNGENDLVKSIEERIAKLTGIPENHGEGMQVLRYVKGGHYKVHHDAFDPRYEGNEPVLKVGGQRIMTFLIYLNTLSDENGGATYFPKLNLRIKPERGKALFWHNVDEHGTIDMMMMHEGMDVLEDGVEKWILTRWIRQRPYVS